MRPQRNGIEYASIPPGDAPAAGVFTPESTELDRASMGAILAAVLAMPGRARGDHPLNSFAAVGRLAHELVDDQSADGVYRPLEVLTNSDGWVILMGVGFEAMTLLHLAEKVAGREPFRRWARDREGKVIMVQAGSCSDGFEQLAPALAPLERRTTVGESRWRVYPAEDTLRAAVDAIRRNPLITHCGRDTCERCRDAVAGGPLLTRRQA